MNTEKKPRARARRGLMVAGGLLLVAACGAGLAYGPELVGLIRLGQQIDAISEENTRLGGAWPRASDACIYCHGFEGNARAQTYPRLAGQPQAYLRKQLQAFAGGERSDPTMTPLALSMTEQELAAYAAHFSKMQPAKNTTFQPDAAQVTRGEALAKAGNCVACHGQHLEGKDQFPRLAGQGYDYLRSQLMRFKSGERRDASGMMPAIATPLVQQDIDDLAQFLASR